MNTISASPAEHPTEPMAGLDARAAPAHRQRVPIWDAPVRVFHWLAVLTFAGAYLTAESERWRLVHASLGYTLVGLVGWRLFWGLVGTRHARFAAFVRGPRAAWDYLRSLLRGVPAHHAGHNPAGALAIVALLTAALGVGASGWAVYEGVGGHASEELHGALASGMLALVLLHVAGVVVGSLAHRENLVRAMVTGRKHAAPAEANRHPRRAMAALLLVAVLGFWGWQAAQAPAPITSAAGVMAHHGGHDDDDD